MLKLTCLIDAKLATPQDNGQLHPSKHKLHFYGHKLFALLSVFCNLQLYNRGKDTQTSDLYRKPQIFRYHQRTEAEGHLRTAAEECMVHVKGL